MVNSKFKNQDISKFLNSWDRNILNLNIEVKKINLKQRKEKATLKKGDIIISINNELSSYPLLFKEFARSKPGTLIKFKILRGEDYLDIELLTSLASS